jgi:hypothetical protein
MAAPLGVALLALLQCVGAELDPPVPGTPRIIPDYVPSLGASVTIACGVDGPGTVVWQWQHDGTNVSAASTGRAELTLANFVASDAGEYRLVAWNNNGTNISAGVNLEIDQRFEVITQGDVVNETRQSIQGAWADYDGDGHLDLAVAGGWWDTGAAPTCALFHNDGLGNLTRVLTGPIAENWDPGSYLAWADYDNDDDLDLVIGLRETRVAVLYVNQGNGEFVEQRTAADWTVNGVEVRGNMIAWGDYDADGRLDLMISNYADQGGDVRPDSLLHNFGGGRFEVLTNSPLALRGTSEETAAWVDFDGDGDLDYSSVESVSTRLRRLFRNLGNGQFEPCLSGCFPNGNLRPFSRCAHPAPVPDVAPGLHAAFPG